MNGIILLRLLAFVFFVVFALFCSNYAIIQNGLPEWVSWVASYVLIALPIILNRNKGYTHGQEDGKEEGAKEGWNNARNSNPFWYNDKENGLPEGFFYRTLWSQMLTPNKILNAVERVSGHTNTIPAYYLVFSDNMRPLPHAFIMKDRVAEEYKPGGGSQH